MGSETAKNTKTRMSGGEINYQPSRQSRILGVHLIFEVFQDTWHYNRNDPCLYCTLPCLVPSWPQIMLISGVAPANRTKERSVHELFAGAFRNKSSM